MRIVFLTGIWPPDVGGPATHGPDFARFLRDRGHQVEVVTMGDAAPSELPVPVHWVRRGLPFVARYPLVAAEGARRARHADVIYATATYAAAAVASAAARRPLVAKLVSDPAYERAWRYGLFRGTLEEFQLAGGSRLRALKRLRVTSLRRARRIVVPSRYLADVAAGWGLGRPIEVLVNPAPAPHVRAPLEAQRLAREWPMAFPAAMTKARWLPPALPTASSAAPANPEARVRFPTQALATTSAEPPPRWPSRRQNRPSYRRL